VKPETDRHAALAWATKARAMRCAVCNAKRPHGHHVITQQVLRRTCASHRLDYERYRWDERNLLPLCERCHAQHHSRFKPVPLAIVMRNTKAIPLAKELHLLWWISREYPNGRIDAWRRRTTRP